MPIIKSAFVAPASPKKMILIISMEYVGQILKNYALFSQYKYIKRRKSVYGLSIDMILGMFFSEIVSVYLYAINFKCLTLAASQYSKKYPLFYDQNKTTIPISSFTLINNFISAFLLYIILKQFKKFYKSKNIYQGVSKIFIMYILLMLSIGCMSFWITENKITGKLNINYSDHLNVLWVLLSYFLSSFYLIPQVSLNFMCQYTLGVSNKFENLIAFATILKFVKNIIMLHSYDLRAAWFRIPFNFETFYTSFWNFILIVLILLQSHIFYLNKKSNVPTKTYANEKHNKEILKII